MEELKLAGSCHPGEHISEHLEARGWSREHFARRTGLHQSLVEKLCEGREPINSHVAIVLEASLNRPRNFWMNLQKNYDAASA